MQQSVGKRVIVIGSSCAGKSTFGEALADRLDAPFIELDALHWEPGWTMAEREALRDRVRQAIEPERWVMAGNYLLQQQDVSWPAADTVIWIDLSLATVLRRCVVRSWQRWRSREELWGTGNRENFLEHLMLWNTDKSLLSYIIRTHHRRRREFAVTPRDERWSHITFVRLRSDTHVTRLLDVIPQDTDLVGAAPALAAASGRGIE